MVHKRKNSPFDRDAFAPHAKVERVDFTHKEHDSIIGQHKAQSFMLGLIFGFVLNTALAVLLVTVQAEIDYKNSQAGVDEAIKIKIGEIDTKLQSMGAFAHAPQPGELAKELNEKSR